MGVWPGRPADLSGPASLILLLQFLNVQATSYTSVSYIASPTISPVPSEYCTGPADCSDKMSTGLAEKESSTNKEEQVSDVTGSTHVPLYSLCITTIMYSGRLLNSCLSSPLFQLCMQLLSDASLSWGPRAPLLPLLLGTENSAVWFDSSTLN